MTETKRENTSVWNEFNRLTHLDLYYLDSSGNNCAEIYANDNNQVKIGIKVRAENKQGQSLKLTEDDLKGKIFLCNSENGNEIDKKRWTLSEHDKGYATAVNYYSVNLNRAKRENNDFVHIVLYLSSSSSTEKQYQFSVGIDIPGVGTFNTSKDGTLTKNGPKGESGSLFKSPKSLAISTLNPINYDSISKFEVSNVTKFHKAVKDMQYFVHGRMSPSGMGLDITKKTSYSSHHHHSGESSYAFFTIRLKNNYDFKMKRVRENKATIQNLDFSFDFVNDSEDNFGLNKEKDVKIFLKRDGEKNSADIIWFHGDEHTTLNFDFLFIEPERCGIKNGSIISVPATRATSANNSLYQYKIGLSDYRHVYDAGTEIPKIKPNEIVVFICRHSIPCAGGFLSFKWGYNYDVIVKPSHEAADIDIADQFGNTGILSISFDENTYVRVITKRKDIRGV